MLWFLAVMNVAQAVGLGYVLWYLRKCNDYTRLAPPQQPTFDTTTLRLCNRLGELKHEISIHSQLTPETYEYGGVVYKRKHSLRNGIRVYQAS